MLGEVLRRVRAQLAGPLPVTVPPLAQPVVVALVEGADVSWREELFLESLYTGRDTPFQEGIRLGKWKYIRMYDGKASYDESDVDFANRAPDFEMLFDLESDPREMNNLIESRADSQILATLRQKCVAHSQALNQRRQRFRDSIEVQRR